MPVIDMKTGKIKRTFVENVKFKVVQAKDWTVEKVRNTVNYVKEDPKRAMEAIGVITLVSGGLTKGVRAINRGRAIREERHHRDLEIYDHSNGQYLELRRKLRKEDIDRLNYLKREKGLRTSEALSRMNLLKK